MNSTPSLSIILAHVPIWVWGILAFILVMGWRQSRHSAMGLARLLMLPAAWLVFGAWGVQSAYGLGSPAALAWLAGLGASVWLVRRSGWPGRVSQEEGRFIVPGSWWPLVLMLGIFAAKFATGMSLALHPEWARQLAFAAGTSALFGLLSGAFIGRTWNIVRPLPASPALSGNPAQWPGQAGSTGSA